MKYFLAIIHPFSMWMFLTISPYGEILVHRPTIFEFLSFLGSRFHLNRRSLPERDSQNSPIKPVPCDTTTHDDTTSGETMCDDTTFDDTSSDAATSKNSSPSQPRCATIAFDAEDVNFNLPITTSYINKLRRMEKNQVGI